MKSFDEFINETVIKLDPSKIDWDKREVKEKLTRVFEDVMIDDLGKVFGDGAVLSLGISIYLDKLEMKIEYSVGGDDETDNLDKHDDQTYPYFDPHINLNGFKHNAMVVEKSIKHFNVSEDDFDVMEIVKRSLAIDVVVHFKIEDFIARYREQIPNEILSLLGIHKYKL